MPEPSQPPRPGTPDDSAANLRNQAQAWSVAMNFAAALGAMTLLGWALERWVWPSASPWLLIAGVGVGVVAGGGLFIRDALRINRS